MKVLIGFLGLVALSAALPVKSSLSDEAVTADFGVLSLLLVFLFSPSFVVSFFCFQLSSLLTLL
jgi:hypothetical protein